MSDSLAAEALRSDAPLVLIEAPAGFGKTFQGAHYAHHLTANLVNQRALILTHTHAARDVFAKRVGCRGDRIEIRTIHSLIIEVATAYHASLGLPENVAAWAYQRGETGFDQVALKVSNILSHSAGVTAALAARYKYLICDEHQDASEAQNDIILAIHRAGAAARIFGDPMQAIYPRKADRDDWYRRWANLQASANRHVELLTPHRWKNNAPELGDWIRDARNALKAGHPINLRGNLPDGLSVIRADNTAQKHGLYMLSKADREQIDNFVENASDLLILAAMNDTVLGLRAFFNRRFPIWEGHTRDELSALVLSCHEHQGDPVSLANAFVGFIQGVSKGFSDNAYADTFRDEIQNGCTGRRRKKPAIIQSLARILLESPDHRGVARAISRVRELTASDPAFSDIQIDLPRELREAERLAQYEDPEEGLLELSKRRTFTQGYMPPKVISTVHKAKGLERQSVMLLPCDKKHFADSDGKRCLLYVALSRPIKSLAIVVPKVSPSPLCAV